MPYNAGPRPSISMRELQELMTRPSGSYGPANPQASPYAPLNPSHEPIEFNHPAEVGFCTHQHQPLLTPPLFPTTDWRWLYEAAVQPPLGFQENQKIWDPAESSLLVQGAAGIGAANGNYPTSSEQNPPHVFANHYRGGDINLPQPSHRASDSNIDPSLHPSTPESLPDTDWKSGHYTESHFTSRPNNTPPILADADFNPKPNYPITPPKHQPPQNHRRSQQNKQDNATSQRERPPASCEECGVHFKRTTDLRRHLRTTIAHNPEKRQFCPEKNCEYSSKGFTREDNLKVHLVRAHAVDGKEAERCIRIGKMKEGQGRHSRKIGWRSKGN
ncbi:hypothetical protein HOY82DRAFT_666243 [Tuber indicum]|nr:hypothetical protein HOY82DRAFT_666243 [Tuber indicum]